MRTTSNIAAAATLFSYSLFTSLVRGIL